MEATTQSASATTIGRVWAAPSARPCMRVPTACSVTGTTPTPRPILRWCAATTELATTGRPGMEHATVTRRMDTPARDVRNATKRTAGTAHLGPHGFRIAPGAPTAPLW